METPSTPHRQTHETSPAVVPSFPLFLLTQREDPFSSQRLASTCVLDLILCWFHRNFPSSLFCTSNSPSQQCSRKELSCSCSYPFNFEEALTLRWAIICNLCSMALTHITVSSPQHLTLTWHLHHFSNETVFVKSPVNSMQSNPMDAMLSYQLTHS